MCKTCSEGAHNAQASKLLTLKKNTNRKMAERIQGNCSVRYSKNADKIYLLLNILYRNTAISDLCAKCFVSQSNNSLWLRPPSSVIRPTAQAASCSFLRSQSLQAKTTCSCVRHVLLSKDSDGICSSHSSRFYKKTFLEG